MKKLFVALVALLSLNACALPPGGVRPAGYSHQGGYLIPPGNTAEEQLRWIASEEATMCSQQSQTTDTVVGAAIGAVGGAVLGGRNPLPGAVVGGVVGGAYAGSSAAQYCATLQRTRGLVMEQINKQRPVVNTDCTQVYNPRSGKWEIRPGDCTRNARQTEVRSQQPGWVPR